MPYPTCTVDAVLSYFPLFLSIHTFFSHICNFFIHLEHRAHQIQSLNRKLQADLIQSKAKIELSNQVSDAKGKYITECLPNRILTLIP